MATLFGSSPFLSHSFTRTPHLSLSSPPPPNPDNQLTPLPSQTPTQLNTSSSELPSLASLKAQQQKPVSTKADATDWIASTLTRRFGLRAALASAAFLALGVVSEQINTRLEVSQLEANTQVSQNVEKEEEFVLPNGIRYYELKVGGATTPRQDELVVIDLMGQVENTGEVFVNTYADNKPVALVMCSRPYGKGMCEGIEHVLRTMKRGGKRRVIVPASLGYGESGADLGSGMQVPPLATLEYIIEVQKISIPPSS